MARKEHPVQESETTPVDVPYFKKVHRLIITPRDKLVFDDCVKLCGLTDSVRKIAYFVVDAEGVSPRGKGIDSTAFGWMEWNLG
jgi:hypothetical protein